MKMRQNIAMPDSPFSAQVPAQVLDLVARFHEHRASYQAQSYNETQLRRDFLDPFFAALGWDMNNSSGTGEEARDVIHEYSMKIDGKNKAPDYCFRNGTTDKFFVEAKKPSVNLKDDPRSAFQTRVYGWNRNLPFCVLTDFEEFAVYDCRFKPKAGDSAHTARAFYCKYDEYEKQWPQIESLFGREAVRGGALEKHATQMPKKGMVAFDQDFLRLIEGWRERLAENIARRNRVLEMSQNDLNYAVQMTIDRVLFLRMCEDRDIEPYEQLKKLVGTKSIYKVLLDLFRQADNRYNSGLFHFSDAKTRSGISDKLTPKLQIDDNILSDILYSLYSPNPYNFRVMSVEILGQVYEQFLGKVIRLDKTKTVVEDKPEVRKAGGVYYTPSYIVDYIVRETVGKMCEGKTPKQIETLRVLDPACGSGSFLLGAYNFLLEWHLDYYIKNEPEKLAAKNKPAIARAIHREMPDENQTQSSKPVWRLTTSEKKRILQNNIFGVDIDRQAVEVSKLSLLLKMLEDESSDSLPPLQGRLIASQERILPDIDGNIKCGNSLIANDFYDDGAHDDLTNEERNRINAFDWNIEYSNVMKAGGFDVVLGNPPYDVMEKERGAGSWPHTFLTDYVRVKPEYNFALGGKLNLFRFFVVQSLALTRQNGCFGMIVPMSLLADISCAETRRHLLLSTNDLVADCFPQKDNANRRVFLQAKLSTVVITSSRLDNSQSKAKLKVNVYPWNNFEDEHRTCVVKYKDLSLLDPKNIPIPLVSSKQWDVCRKLHSNSLVVRLGNCSGFVVNRGEINQTIYRAFINSNTSLARLVKGSEIGQYQQHQQLSQGSREWFDERRYSKTNSAKPIAQQRRIVTQRITGVDEKLRVVATIIESPAYFADSTNSVIATNESKYKLEYLLGFLNSTLTQWRFKLTSTNNNVGTNELNSLPFRMIDFSDKADIARHDAMVKLVEQMLALHKQLAQARTSQDETSTRRQIASTDARIDKLVYELYELTAEEIAVVEGA